MSYHNEAVTSDPVVSEQSNEKLTGCVKWFNNKDGYGFITVTDGPKVGTDIFVHHRAINVVDQYRYLVQGEYVEFVLVPVEGGKYEYQASNVSGINAGKLMCETRRDFKVTRTNYKGDVEMEHTQDVEHVRMPRQTRPNKTRGEGPRDYTLVKKNQRDFSTKSGNYVSTKNSVAV